MVSAGAGPGYTPAGVDGDVDSDAPAPLAGPGARRIAYVETKHTPRRLETAPEGARSVPEETVRQRSDLLFVPGDPANLRIGYRVPEDAPSRCARCWRGCSTAWRSAAAMHERDRASSASSRAAEDGAAAPRAAAPADPRSCSAAPATGR